MNKLYTVWWTLELLLVTQNISIGTQKNAEKNEANMSFSKLLWAA